MKRFTTLPSLLALLFLCTGCSTVKVLDSYTSKDVRTIRNKNILVIARTSHEPSRIAFEESITKQLDKNGLRATESFKKFPEMKPDRKLTPQEIKEIKELFKKEGINAVVVSILKDVEEITQTDIEGGYTAGASLASYTVIPNIGFYGYYAYPYSFSTYDGVDVEKTYTTHTTRIFVLETSVHNLDLTEKDQLIALVTSKIIEPDKVYEYADQYAKAIYKALKNNKQSD